MLTGVVALALALGCGRGDTSKNSNEGDLRVMLPDQGEPVREGDFDFGAVPVGESQRSSLMLVNVGSDLARITASRFEEAPAGTFFAQAPDQVGAGEQATLVLTFAPTEVGPVTGRLVLDHDGTSVRLSLNLHGEGVAP